MENADLYMCSSHQDINNLINSDDSSIVSGLISACNQSDASNYPELIRIQKHDDIPYSDKMIHHFSIESVEFETIIEFHKNVLANINATTFWCFYNSGEGFEYYLKCENGEYTELYVDSDGGDEEYFPVDKYKEWHQGLPESIQKGCLGCFDDMELFGEVSSRLEDNQPIDEYIPKIKGCKNINFVTGYNEDAFTYICEYGDLTLKDETLSLLELVIACGFDLNRVVANKPILVRAINASAGQSEQENETKAEIVKMLLENGVTPNFVSNTDSFGYKPIISKLDECDETREEGYFTVFNVVAEYERPESLYYIIMPYADPLLIKYALKWNQYWGSEYCIPAKVITEMEKKLS